MVRGWVVEGVWMVCAWGIDEMVQPELIAHIPVLERVVDILDYTEPRHQPL